MFKLSTKIELPIAHCLSGAYSGLCCGNVYRDKGQCDGKNDRYDLGDKVLPILHGHNYVVTVDLLSTVTDEDFNCLNEDNMVVDFKLYKKILHEFFDQYDHSMILAKGNPLIDVYRKNYEENGIDFERSRLFIWEKNPTAEYMAIKWTQEVQSLLKAKLPKPYKGYYEVVITVEETSNNSVTFVGED